MKILWGLQEQKKAIFAQLSYKCIIRVEGRIRKTSNPAYGLSKDRRVAVFNSYLSEVYRGHTPIGTQVKFK